MAYGGLMFDRQASIDYWLNDWDEGLTLAQAEEMADSEEIDHVLEELAGIASSAEGEGRLAQILAGLKTTLASIRSESERSARPPSGRRP